ncbi:O-antigen polysaccharide polymerase Wzy [Bacillus sp. S13(2024)]|uniref:O-antigen polysaccharide polymerase Wzy n=1 Tax=unclassified Bacillus (in: firmicutes) TaxID=185979 RepID=UPI003D240C4E
MRKKSSLVCKREVIIVSHSLFIFFMTLIGIVMLTYEKNTISNFDVVFFGWIGNILFVWCVLSWKYMKGYLFHPYILFLLSFFVYLYGQAFLKSLGISLENFDLYVEFTHAEMLAAQLYTCLCMAFLHLGAILSIRDYKDRKSNVMNRMENISSPKTVKIVAWIFVIVSVYPYFHNVLDDVKNSLNNGYLSLYENENISGSASNMIQSLSMFFIPGLFFLLICYKENKLILRLISGVILFSVLIGYMTGGRGTATSLIIAFIWLWHVQIKPFKGYKVFILITIGFILFSTLPVISEFRLYSNRDIGTFFDLYQKKMIEDNLIVSGIGELGGSMFPLVKVMNIMPDIYSFKLGESYFSSIMAIIPSSFFGGYSFADLADLPNWLMKVLKMDYGPGFSIVAEAYYNFGWFGPLFMSILGYAFGKLFDFNFNGAKRILIRNALAAITLYILINNVRASLLLTVRLEVYMVILPYFLLILFCRPSKKQISKEFYTALPSKSISPQSFAMSKEIRWESIASKRSIDEG